MRRRDFIRRLGSATAAVAVPAFSAGCVSAYRDESDVPQSIHLTRFELDDATLTRVLAALGANGGQFGEAYFQRRNSRALELERGVLVKDSRERLLGVGLRVVRENDVGFAATEDLTEAGMTSAAQRAAAGGAAAGPVGTVPTLREQPLGHAYTTTRAWSDVSHSRPVALMERVETAAAAADPAVSAVRVSWQDVDEHVLIASLDGHLVFDDRPMTRMSLQTTLTRGGREHTGFASIAARADVHWYTDERLAELVHTALERTDRLFDARQPPTGEMPVVLAAGEGAVVLHEAIGHALEADFALDGRSPYRDALNSRIADTTVSIFDQGTLAGERGALNYDDEGSACGRHALVEQGVLRTFLHDRRSARDLAAASTASARRESYRFAPLPRMSCTYLGNGRADPEELVTALGRGVIAETFVGATVSLGEGSYRFKVRNGWLVEKGKRLTPLRDFELVGRGAETLANIRLVANDFRMDPAGWSCGKRGQTVPVSHGMPSVLISRLNVAV